MAQIGFTVFQEATTPEQTVPELLAAMTGPQKTAVLDGFAEKVHPVKWRQWAKDQGLNDVRVKRPVIRRLYEEILNMKNYAALLMQGQVVDTPAIPPNPEVEGDEGTPATYLPVPTGIMALRAAIAAEFKEVFNTTESNAVVNKMVAYSHPDKNGDFAYYAAGYSS